MGGPTEPIFLPFMYRLRVLEIYLDPHSTTMSDFGILYFVIRSLRVGLTSPAALEHLKFDIVFSNYYMHDTVDRDLFYDDLREADIWSHLDTIITHPTGSQLQRVEINIRSFYDEVGYTMEPDNSGASKPVLDALPLLREKRILFVKVTCRRLGLDR